MKPLRIKFETLPVIHIRTIPQLSNHIQYNTLMPTQYYSQNDPRYKSLLLGYNTASDGTIGRFGCLITGWGNTLNDITDTGDFDPVTMNNWLKSHNGFVPGGGVMYWSAPLKLGFVEAYGTSADLNYVNQWLKDPPNYALIEFNNGAHWSVAVVTGKIIDSNDGRVKPITSYKFTGAHLFRATGGKGVASVNNSEGAMTKEEEIVAYRILLGHEPDVAVPSGRSAMQLIFDVKPLLDTERRESHDVNAALQSEVDTANVRVSALQSQVDELHRQAEAAAPATVPVETAPNFVNSEVLEPRTRVVVGDHLMLDYSGRKPGYQLTDGMVFHQVSTFVANGQVLARTQRSVENDDWYGADDTWFADDPSGRQRDAETRHVALSMGAGLAGRLVNWFRGLVKH